MISDPLWIAVLMSGVAALMAALAFVRSGRADPALTAATGTLSEVSARVDVLRSLLSDNSQREREEAETRARGFREEIGGQIKDGFTRFDECSRALREEVVKLVTTLGETTTGSVAQLGKAQAERLGDTVQRVQSLSEATERHLLEMKKDAADGGRALREEVNAQLQGLLTSSATP
jgi:hypothetical protein